MSAVALAIGIGAGGLLSGAGSIIASSGGSSPYKQARDTARGTTRGYYQTNPLNLAMNQAYQPAYLSLGADNLQRLLFGAPAESYDRQVGWGMKDNGRYKYTSTVREEIPGQTGILDLLQQAMPRLQGLYQSGAQQGAQNNLDLLNEFLPQAQAYEEAANPETQALRRALGSSATQQLGMGSQWNPEDLNRTTNGIRSDWANRGLGTSLPAGFAEAVGIMGGGEGLRAQRQNFALNANQQLSATQPDYARFIFGLGGNPVGDAMNLVTGQQPLTFQGNNFAPYAGTSAANAGLASQQAAASNRSDLFAGLGGGLLSLAGNMMGQYYGNQNALNQRVAQSIANGPVYR